MRYKFRAWDKATRTMRNVMQINFANKAITIEPIFSDGSFYNFAKTDKGFTCGIVRDYDAVELMQYTGLKDKTGKAIYEGDIIHFPSTKMGQCESTKVVIWDDEDKYIALCNLNEYRNKEFFDKDNIQEMIVFYIEDLVNAEIIGNKFDNPELLEVEE